MKATSPEQEAVSPSRNGFSKGFGSGKISRSAWAPTVTLWPKKVNGMLGLAVHKQGRSTLMLTLNMALVGSTLKRYIRFWHRLLWRKAGKVQKRSHKWLDGRRNWHKGSPKGFSAFILFKKKIGHNFIMSLQLLWGIYLLGTRKGKSTKFQRAFLPG